MYWVVIFTSKGYLLERDLEDYIFDQIDYYTQLQGLEEQFKTFYVLTAVRKFFFFLDPWSLDFDLLAFFLYLFLSFQFLPSNNHFS